MINAITDSLIYDRTQADVDYALMLERESIYTKELLRGAYNASDRLRVAEAINYLASLVRLNSIHVRDDWNPISFAVQIATVADNENTVEALNVLKAFLPGISATVPADLDRLSYNKANDVERVLFELYGVYMRLNAFFVGDGYASDFDVGGGAQAFDDNWNFSFTL